MTYENDYEQAKVLGEILRFICKSIEFGQAHRLEEAIAGSYGKC